MSITSDTGPLVVLAKVDLLSLLRDLHGGVRIPPAVEAEILAKPGPETPRLQAALAAYIHVVSVAVPPASLAGLGPGEQEAITLALATKTTLLIDDRAGRAAASRLGVPITGTAGLLVDAKTAGLIPEVRSTIEALQRVGYYLADPVVRAVLAMAGE